MKFEKGKILFGKRSIVFLVKRSKRRRTVSIFVDPFEGVFLRAPLSPSLKYLSSLVYSKATWILEKQRQINEIICKLPKREFVTGETFVYLGRQLRLKVINSKNESNPNIIVKEGRFNITLGDCSKIDKSKIVRDTLITWYKKHAKVILLKRVEIYSKRLNLSNLTVILGNQTKRWGSCNRKGQTRFNWRIIMAPMTLVDYLVVHELCHLKYNNHSENFWKLIGSILPDYETRRQRLRKEGPLYYF